MPKCAICNEAGLFRGFVEKCLFPSFIHENSMFPSAEKFFRRPMHWCGKNKKEPQKEKTAPPSPPPPSTARPGSSRAQFPSWSSMFGASTHCDALVLCFAVYFHFFNPFFYSAPFSQFIWKVSHRLALCYWGASTHPRNCFQPISLATQNWRVNSRFKVEIISNKIFASTMLSWKVFCTYKAVPDINIAMLCRATLIKQLVR